jgi:oxygen-dependent protoporphyrinogen oxidase
MGELVDALIKVIHTSGGTVRMGAEVEAVAAGVSGARLAVKVKGDAEAIAADDVILCAPAFAAADALDGLDRELSGRLREIPYVSTATITLGFARADIAHPLDASGLIIPRTENLRSLAATFISSKWAGRCPSDMVLIRVFAGGYRDPEALTHSDPELVVMARAELDALLGIRARPLLTRVFRWDRANAQPSVGHPDRLRKLRAGARRHPGLHFAGAAFDGVGIPDCIRQANEVAERIVESEAGTRAAPEAPFAAV